MLFALFSAFMMILLLSACASVLIVHHNGCKQAACEQNRIGGGVAGTSCRSIESRQERARGRDAKGKEKRGQPDLAVL